jgi:hypothetical protein
MAYFVRKGAWDVDAGDAVEDVVASRLTASDVVTSTSS